MSKTKKENAEEDYPQVPISVLSYIGSLEKELADLKGSQFLDEVCRWQPIEKMVNHVHGLYLVMYDEKDSPIDNCVSYNIQEKYFTYKDNKTCFQSEEDAKNAIAFAVPRYYPRFDGSEKEVLVKENESLQKRLRELKEATRWRDSKIELPKDDQLTLYLCYYGGNRYEINFLTENWKYYFEMPTHWMPIPNKGGE